MRDDHHRPHDRARYGKNFDSINWPKWYACSHCGTARPAGDGKCQACGKRGKRVRVA